MVSGLCHGFTEENGFSANSSFIIHISSLLSGNDEIGRSLSAVVGNILEFIPALSAGEGVKLDGAEDYRFRALGMMR